MKFKKEQLLLYAITDRRFAVNGSLLAPVEAALQGGVTMVQLREKSFPPAGLPPEAFLAEARALAALCHRFGVPLIVDDRVDIALACNADGVHLGADDMPVAEARRLLGKDAIIGATAKTLTSAETAARGGADYLGIGALFSSPTKENALRRTPAEVAQIAAATPLPSVAIGGLTSENIPVLKQCGVNGAAMVSAIFDAPDIAARAALLRKKLEAILLFSGEESVTL